MPTAQCRPLSSYLRAVSSASGCKACKACNCEFEMIMAVVLCRPLSAYLRAVSSASGCKACKACEAEADFSSSCHASPGSAMQKHTRRLHTLGGLSHVVRQRNAHCQQEQARRVQCRGTKCQMAICITMCQHAFYAISCSGVTVFKLPVELMLLPSKYLSTTDVYQREQKQGGANRSAE